MRGLHSSIWISSDLRYAHCCSVRAPARPPAARRLVVGDGTELSEEEFSDADDQLSIDGLRSSKPSSTES